MERYELPDGWEWSTLGESCLVNTRDPALKKLSADATVSFVPMAAVGAERGIIANPVDRPLNEVRKGFTPFSDGDVIFAKITPSMENGKAAIASGLTNGFGFGSTEFHVMRPKEAVTAEWVFHFIRQQSFRDEAKSSFTGTAGQMRVPEKFILDTDIPLPPLHEQRRIIQKIESLFEQSRTARAALTHVPVLMAQFRRAVLASAFRGELVEPDPNDEPAKLLLERIHKAREQSGHKQSLEPVDPSELLELPRGWEWAKVEQIAEVRLGRQRSPSRATGPNMRPYLRAANVTWSGLNLSDVKEMDFTPAEQDTYRLRTGDIVLSEASGSISEVGKPAIWNDEIENCCIQNTLIRVRSDGPLPGYLYYHFLFDALTARFSEVAQGIGINHLGAKGLSNWVISIPPLQAQQRIVDKIKSLFAQADIIEQAASVSLRRAEQVDQSILARAFRGELG